MSTPAPAAPGLARSPDARLDYLDATRAFALLLGIVFHASLSFMPVFIGWAVMDVSTSPLVAKFVTVSHAFRMETFFLLAGFFAHGSFHRQGAAGFLRARTLRLLVPFVVGWFMLRPLLVSGWIMGGASLRGEVDVMAGLQGGLLSLKTLPAGLFTGSHLWFLYYLMLLTLLALGIRALVRVAGRSSRLIRRRLDAAVGWLAASPFALPALVGPTAFALWFMRYWGVDTPDQSLVPHGPVSAVYGGFFGLGWLLGRQRHLLEPLTRLTPRYLLPAAAAMAGVFLLQGVERDPGHAYYTPARAGYAVAYATMIWTFVFLTIGVCRHLFRRPHRLVRYLADSSYWMYLIHLPIVVWLQVAVAEIPAPWFLKLAMVTALTVVLCLATYELFVRSTRLGQFLNGRRHPRAWLALPPARGAVGVQRA